MKSMFFRMRIKCLCSGVTLNFNKIAKILCSNSEDLMKINTFGTTQGIFGILISCQSYIAYFLSMSQNRINLGETPIFA